MSVRKNYAAMSRRAAVAGAALAAMAALAGCDRGGGGVAEGDMAQGAPEGAKVTVVEYASVTCPHCAAWQEQVYPQFKAKYVDTNQVRYVFREMPTPPANVAVAGFLIARCAGSTDKYFQVVHEIMASQKEWQAGANPRDSLFRIGNGVGLNDQQIQACITDKDGLAASDARTRAAQGAGVTGTPHFTVNGVHVTTPGSNAGASFEDLSKAIDAELAKG